MISQDMITHPAYIRKLRQAGGEAMSKAQTDESPAVDAGLFDYPEWEPGMVFEKKNSFFLYGGKVGFTRQAGITAQAHQPPFSTGMESVSGVRPRQGPDGVYPYEYNMRSDVGMRVRSKINGSVYVAIQPADPLLFDPAEISALFDLEA